VERSKPCLSFWFVLGSRQHAGIDKVKKSMRTGLFGHESIFESEERTRRCKLKQQQLLVIIGLSFGNLPYLQRRGPSSFERRLLKEFEEYFHVLVTAAFDSFELFLQRHRSAYMGWSSHLHVSMPHVEELADLLCCFPQYFL
jgi:hypothetical protein